MSLHPRRPPTVPDETARAARAAFRRGNPYVLLRDHLGPLFADEEFLALYAYQGPPALSPACLATVCVLQYAEDLSDRQTADAVRSRIDWKYLLGLSLHDPGFDASDLSEFRRRLLAAGAERQIFERVLTVLTEHGLVRGEQQRTDSTHVLGAIHALNRLELVRETMRTALDALALTVPDWLGIHHDPSWLDRYGPRVEAARLPKTEQERFALAQVIGADGFVLLTAVDSDAPNWLRMLPALQILRTVWLQQYRRDGTAVIWRKPPDLPPGAVMLQSPHDQDVRYSEKRATTWVGYKVHLTETCVPRTPAIITQVTTTAATTTDDTSTRAIQADLTARNHRPHRHLVDAGYLDGEILAASATQGIDLVGPVSPDTSWQAKAAQGFALANFTIDWDEQVVTCPQGQRSSTWRTAIGSRGEACVQVHFRRADCQACPVRGQCTHGDRRSLTLRPQAHHQAKEQARARQQTVDFWTVYAARAGIEATISQGVRRCDLRHARYRSLPAVSLQHQITAAAINLVRAADWLAGHPRAGTRQSPFVRTMAHAA
jgi:transposase